MTDIPLKYVNGYRDCRGRMRYYVRRQGQKRIALPGLPGSKAFLEAYQAAMSGQEIKRVGERSVAALFASYYNSAAFRDRSEGTQTAYRKALHPIEALHGHRNVVDLPHDKARKLIEDMGAEHPGMANLTLAVLRKAFAHAIKLQWRSDNPFIGIERYKLGTHHTWTDDQLARYQRRWPIGTRERVLFDLLYYTAQRVGDVAKMKRSDIGPNGIYVQQQKTGVELRIPLHPSLKRSLNEYGIRGGQYLVGSIGGGQISAAGLSAVIAKAVEKAGLPAECVPHGIRKAVLRTLAEKNVSTKVIASMSGHKTLKEIERYTEKADQGRMVVAAIGALPEAD